MGSTLHVHDLYRRPGIFIASHIPIHYNVNHRHTKLNATKSYLLWYIIRVFRPTHRVCNDTMENVMFQGDSANSLSSVVINSCRFYIGVSVHHKSVIYNKPTRCNSGSIVFINNYKYALHVSDALCVHHQEPYKL